MSDPNEPVDPLKGTPFEGLFPTGLPPVPAPDDPGLPPAVLAGLAKMSAGVRPLVEAAAGIRSQFIAVGFSAEAAEKMAMEILLAGIKSI